ncbi:MAG TPA: ATP-binding protein [Symbiobacteriaceae bacterium]|nr:ATP-binding protein [Symbiobacteriaceae bacterium]
MKRVLLLLEQRANAELLAGYLRKHHEVVVGAPDQPWPASFDLGIIDGSALDRLEPLVKQRRAAAHPVLLPFLLVTSRPDIGLATHHVWQSVDELILTPIQKLELQTRVEVLLRARELSQVNFRILSAAGEGILGLDGDGIVTQANATAELLLGYPGGGLIGRFVGDLVHTPGGEPQQAQAESSLRAALRAGTARRQRTGWFRHGDGTVFPADFVLTPLEAGNGAAGAVLLFDDLSELQRLNDTLEQKVIERTADLLCANQELESFGYMVSHDLRGPLQTVSGYSEALLEDYGDQLDGDGRDYLERIMAATNRMNGIIDGLLRLSRVSRVEMVRTRVDVSHLARSVAAEIAGRYPARSVSFRVADGLSANADARLVQTALENLLDNAWKYTARAAAPVIEVGATPAGGGQVFFVRDNGVGFDMRHRDRLFKPFEQLNDPAEFAGFGVGLAIVNRVVTRHGGRIWAEAAVGEGATFYFTLEPVLE